MAKAVKYGDGSFGMGTEWLHDFLFDRYRVLNANPLTTDLFKDKAGDTRNGVVLTRADTNNKGDRVPTKQKWYLWDLRVIYKAMEPRTDVEIQLIYDWLDTTILLLKVENLDTLFSVPISCLRPTLQLVSAPAVTVNSRFSQEDNHGKQDFRVPVVLEQNAVWGLTLEETVASAAGLDNDFVRFVWDREMYRES